MQRNDWAAFIAVLKNGDLRISGFLPTNQSIISSFAGSFDLSTSIFWGREDHSLQLLGLLEEEFDKLQFILLKLEIPHVDEPEVMNHVGEFFELVLLVQHKDHAAFQ